MVGGEVAEREPEELGLAHGLAKDGCRDDALEVDERAGRGGEPDAMAEDDGGFRQ